MSDDQICVHNIHVKVRCEACELSAENARLLSELARVKEALRLAVRALKQIKNPNCIGHIQAEVALDMIDEELALLGDEKKGE